MARKELLPPALAYIADNIINKHNILGASKDTRAKWAKDLKLPGKNETVFFSGCGYQYTGGLTSLMSLIRKTDKSAIGADRLVGIASFQKKLGIDATGIYSRLMGSGADDGAQPLVAAVKVLQKLGVDFGYLGADEPCCGGILHFEGLESDFNRNAREVYQQFKSRGVKSIISIVPSCTYTLQSLMPNHVVDYDLEVKHFIQVVAERIDKLGLRFPREAKVTYHDPCQLSRYLKIVDEPRQILKAINGLQLVEPEWTRGEWSTCCGGGAGFEAVFPEMSEILAVNRVKELLETGAEIIVTHCPGCIMQLKHGLSELKVEGVAVLDLAQVLAMALEV
jgi:Fe-S oxidoreductase